MDNEHTHDSVNHSADTFSQRRAMLAGLGGLAAGALMARSAQAGPLNPPPGPISSTPGPEARIPLTQETTPGNADCAFRITQPGSYYLTGNLSIFNIGGLVDGIRVAASDVTIDLNGYTIRSAANGRDGIVAESGHSRITVRNGFVHAMGRDGIALGMANESVVERVSVSRCNELAIDVGDRSRVRDCLAVGSLGASTSRAIGIRLGAHSTVQDCTASDNATTGIQSSLFCIIERCAAQSNGVRGIFAFRGSSIVNCAASENGENGIDLDEKGLVSNCVAHSNGANGIRVENTNRVIGNTCESNGLSPAGAGIVATSIANLIESNHCTVNRCGIEVFAGGNMILRNTCKLNTTNWSVSTGNVILVVNAATAGSVNGDSGGTSPGSSNPNANYTF